LAEAFYQNLRHAGTEHIKLLRRRPGQINDPRCGIGAAIIHPHRYLAVVLPVGNTQHCPEWQGLMGRRKVRGVKNFPRRGGASGKFGAIPGRDAFLPENAVTDVPGLGGAEHRRRENE
jgi:hypothetical protein